MPSPPRQESRTAGSVLLAAASLAIALVALGAFGPLLAAGAAIWLVVHVLRRVGAKPPPFPAPEPTLAWIGKVLRWLVAFAAWAAPHVPFLAPGIVFVVVARSLPDDRASLAFLEQSSQIIPVLLIGFVIEAGALRWRSQPVDLLLSLVTAAILVGGEACALRAIADGEPAYVNYVAGAMAAGVVAIGAAAGVAALEERRRPPQAQRVDGG